MPSQNSYNNTDINNRAESNISPPLPAKSIARSVNEENRLSAALTQTACDPSTFSSSAIEPPVRNVATRNNSNLSVRGFIGGDSNGVPVEEQPRPAFGPDLGQVDFDQDGLVTKAKVSNDGRLNINIDQHSRQLSDILVPALESQLDSPHQDSPPAYVSSEIPPSLGGLPGQTPPPPMNVVIHVVGSRGDVQPFVALGKVLREKYGHRVRLATHGTFKSFVEDNGLEFFCIGGDPAELMAFMVKNPGLMPGMQTLKSGDIGKRRRGMYEIMEGAWKSCVEDGNGTNDTIPTLPDNGSEVPLPFVADAIIANPPSFAHIHCAEKLGVPLHLMFTMPWSPTRAFPHPLANVQSSNADPSTTNYVSYALVDMMTWQGLGDIINRFRKKSLKLEPVSVMWAPGMATRLQIPYTYCWSPALIPKPKDWGAHINISGFYFLSLASAFTPAPDLQAFLDAGPSPVYIGFGSIVVDDPDGMTKLIFEAVKKSGQRALVSKGWGGFGADQVPDGIFMLGNVPHDWLFKRVSCVVHHGGAGTTAAGIALGKPTVVVPFFGDQPFWGAMIARAGAGPLPIPNKELTSDKLTAGILECLKSNTIERAQELGAKISSEHGTTIGAESFHDKLDIDSLRCAIVPDRVAVWRVKRTTIRLSAFAAATLHDEGLLDFNDLKLYRPREYDLDGGPWDPISGVLAECMGITASLMMGVSDIHVGTAKALHFKSADSEKKTNKATTSQQRVSQSASSSKLGTKSEVQRPTSQDHTNSKTNSSGSTDAQTRSLAPTEESTALKVSKSISQQLGASGAQASVGATKGIGKIMGEGLKSPMSFTYGLARGFRNAPKLYGDDTVRQPDKITGVQSGFKAVGKEFGLGLYDGLTGLVTQPVRGAQKEGFTGALKGIGKGIGGVILKPSAAACGVPGYAFKGIYKEMQKRRGASLQDYIIAARTAQGYEDWNKSSPEQRKDVVNGWQAIQTELGKDEPSKRKESHQDKDRISRQTDHPGVIEGGGGREKEEIWPDMNQGKDFCQYPENMQELAAHDPMVSEAPDSNIQDTSDSITPVQDSLAATPKVNSEEDQAIEKAIRGLVMGLKQGSDDGSDPDARERAIKSAVAEVVQARASATSNDSAADTIGDNQHDEESEKALRKDAARDQPVDKPVKRKPVPTASR